MSGGNGRHSTRSTRSSGCERLFEPGTEPCRRGSADRRPTSWPFFNTSSVGMLSALNRAMPDASSALTFTNLSLPANSTASRSRRGTHCATRSAPSAPRCRRAPGLSIDRRLRRTTRSRRRRPTGAGCGSAAATRHTVGRGRNTVPLAARRALHDPGGLCLHRCPFGEGCRRRTGSAGRGGRSYGVGMYSTVGRSTDRGCGYRRMSRRTSSGRSVDTGNP